MKLKLISIAVLTLLCSIYLILNGIKLYKHKIIIKHLSEREVGAFFTLLLILIQIIFIENDEVNLIGLAIGLTAIIFYVLYLSYSRLNDVKYAIYNVKEEIYEEVVKKILNENFIKFSQYNDFIEFTGISSHIEFIDKGFLIKKYKRIPNYPKLLQSLETNFQNIEYEKKTKEWIIEIVTGLLFIVLAIFEFAMIWS